MTPLGSQGGGRGKCRRALTKAAQPPSLKGGRHWKPLLEKPGQPSAGMEGHVPGTAFQALEGQGSRNPAAAWAAGEPGLGGALKTA